MADRARIAHLLRRATFGPTAEEVDDAERAGYDATVRRLVEAAGTAADAPVFAAPAVADRQQANQERRAQVTATIEWWLDRMVAAEDQLAEKMVFFWHGHWATSAQKVKTASLMLGQLKTFREYGRGEFTAFVTRMVRDPALILWLDGQKNTVKAPNENLARELMELFTLGIGSYTEDDVKAGARALTGWTVDRRAGTVRFAPRRHDKGTKTVLGRTAAFDADSLAALVAREPAGAAFLARRFWFRFASGEPIADDVLARLENAFAARRDVDDLLRALFTDEAFAGTHGHLVKQPVEWAVGALRQLGIRPSRLTDQQRKQLVNGLGGLDQVPLRPPSVGGWPAGAAWLTTSSLQARVRLAELLADRAAPAVLERLKAAPTAGRPDALARLLVVDAWTDRTRAVLAGAAGKPERLLQLGLISPEYTVH
ncbi:hypothetical protein Ais01nite_47520 [Asanoa ishikariensis]|uniref:Uncharacterized conserved protein, DUF1800 family n=1 Tax=Asanoa ishikariensis TaxID=137265 RepID=A0A1H3RXK8_9ACTN|nr:DUF1800 domain-containing protein [Asanoa ishikariensis]GIF66717.1 hypothetical protein Ais01nite_47520 [Asanoa ishikariensis]SDZ30367.1 Uncharacterized conserved protein, DUF1800 family [Asanoa ishikariensis]